MGMKMAQDDGSNSFTLIVFYYFKCHHNYSTWTGYKISFGFRLLASGRSGFSSDLNSLKAKAKGRNGLPKGRERQTETKQIVYQLN